VIPERGFEGGKGESRQAGYRVTDEGNSVREQTCYVQGSLAELMGKKKSMEGTPKDGAGKRAGEAVTHAKS